MDKINKTVLVVDDEDSLRKALSEELKYQGLNIIEAKDGKEGLAKALKNHPDLIMLDIIMPNMDGKQMALQLQKDGWGKTVPIIFLTNVSDPIKISDITQTAVGNTSLFDYLIKSEWEMDKVVERVNKKLGIESSTPADKGKQASK